MSNVRLRLPPKLIESARAAQYANRERQGVKETNKKVAYRAKIEAKKQKKEQQQDEQRGGQLEHVKAKSYKVWTHPYCVCGGFLLIPSAIPDGTQFGAPPTYSFVSQEWVRKNPNDPNDNSLVLRTVITPNPNGSLIRMSLAEGDFDTCEYAALGDIRTPQDQYQHPGIWDGSSAYNALEQAAPGFVFDAGAEMLVNSATYESDRSFLTWIDGQGAEWPIYVDDFLATRNFGFFYHVATKTPPPAKTDQGIYETYGALVPLRFKRDPSTQDNQNTPKDESIEAFGGDVYSTCTFEIIVALGTAPPFEADPNIKEIDNTLPAAPGSESKLMLSREIIYDSYSFNYNPHIPGRISEGSSFYDLATYGTIQSSSWSEYSRGQLIVVIGDITFSIETLNRPTEVSGLEPKNKWVIYYWSSDETIDGFIEVEPSQEYHLAVVYQKNINPNPAEGEPDTTQTCEIFVNGSKVASLTRAQEVSGSKLMATAVAGLSEKHVRRLNENPQSSDVVKRKIRKTYRLLPGLGPYYQNADGTSTAPNPLPFDPIGSDERYIDGGAFYYWPPNQSGFPRSFYYESIVVVREFMEDEVVSKYPPSIASIEPTTQCRVGFHSLRFTPEQALYSENFTPPTKITSLA